MKPKLIEIEGTYFDPSRIETICRHRDVTRSRDGLKIIFFSGQNIITYIYKEPKELLDAIHGKIKEKWHGAMGGILND